MRGSLEATFPSAGLYYHLGQAAEASEDGFHPGYLCCGSAANLLLSGIDYYRKGIKLFGENGQLYVAIADVYLKARQYQFATASCLNALLLGVEDPEVFYKAAISLYHSFNFEGAMKLISAACEKDPSEKHFEAFAMIRKCANGKNPSYSG